jgi:hypothetical protein
MVSHRFDSPGIISKLYSYKSIDSTAAQESEAKVFGKADGMACDCFNFLHRALKYKLYYAYTYIILNNT